MYIDLASERMTSRNLNSQQPFAKFPLKKKIIRVHQLEWRKTEPKSKAINRKNKEGIEDILLK